MPTVIKYSTQPSEQSQPNPPHGSKNRHNDTPVVIKYLQEYTSPNSTDSTMNSKPITSQAEPKSKDLSINMSKSIESQVEADNNSAAMPISQKSRKTSFERHSLNKPEGVVSGGKNVEQSQASHGSKRPEKKDLAQPTGKHVKVKARSCILIYSPFMDTCSTIIYCISFPNIIGGGGDFPLPYPLPPLGGGGHGLPLLMHVY